MLPDFIADHGTKFDLATTLPSGVARGGTFAVDPQGAKLPPGMHLAPSGILSVGSAKHGRAVGVIFQYEEPG